MLLSASRGWSVAAGVSLAAAIVALYTTHFDRTPPYLAHDEVLFALNAESIAATGRDVDRRFLPLFFSDAALGEAGREPLSIYTTSVIVAWLRDDEYAVRLASAIVGLINVALMFVVARRYFGEVTAATGAALLLAVTPVHVFYSRVGVEVVYLLPFVLAWLYFLVRPQPSFALASLSLGLSVYSYKAAQLLVPVLLGLTVAAAVSDAATQRVRRALTCVGVFVLAVLPYVVVSSQTARYATFSNTYNVGDSGASVASNISSFLETGALSKRVVAYASSFHPRQLFLSGDASWTDSTRTAGMFLLPMAPMMLVGLYAAIQRAGWRSWLVVAALFASAVPSLVMGEAVSRRMIAMVPFATLLAVEGYRYLARHSRLARWTARLMAVGIAAYFAVYYSDYLTDYRERSFKYWELNLAGALRELAARDQLRGRTDRAVIVVDNVYIREYARFLLPKYGSDDLIPRLEFVRLMSTPPPPEAHITLLLRQLAGDEPSTVCPPSEGWLVTSVVREVNGEPGFAICERGSATISGFGTSHRCHWRCGSAWQRHPQRISWRMAHRRVDTAGPGCLVG